MRSAFRKVLVLVFADRFRRRRTLRTIRGAPQQHRFSAHPIDAEHQIKGWSQGREKADETDPQHRRTRVAFVEDGVRGREPRRKQRQQRHCVRPKFNEAIQEIHAVRMLTVERLQVSTKQNNPSWQPSETQRSSEG